jgi:hypothetical protein
MFSDVLAVETGSRDLESLRVVAVALPWAYSSSGYGAALDHRRFRIPGMPRRPYAGVDYAVRDPASDGKSYLRARCSLEWFPLRSDGLSDEFPELSRISVLRATRFAHEELARLHAEIEQIMPHLVGDDALLFDAVNFLIEEVLAHGRGGIEFRPDLT